MKRPTVPPTGSAALLVVGVGGQQAQVELEGESLKARCPAGHVCIGYLQVVKGIVTIVVVLLSVWRGRLQLAAWCLPPVLVQVQAQSQLVAVAKAEKGTQIDVRPEATSRRHVAVQGPATYYWWRAHPRYDALPERRWGAWDEECMP